MICVVSGDYGKPCPAVVVQSDLFNETHDSLTVCPITSHISEAPLFRLSLSPNKQNGLKVTSQVMVDKLMSVRRDKLHEKVGRLSEYQINKLNDAIGLWLSIKN